jgi:hypothetical protein
MSTKKPVADPDIAPEYDFTDAVPNPFAARYRADYVPVITGTDARDSLARAARVRGTTLIVSFVDGRELRVPISWFPRLAAASAAARANLRITAGGRSIHWPDLDEDIGVEPLLTAVR